MVLAFLGGMWISLGFTGAARLAGGGDAYDYWAFTLPHPYATYGGATTAYSPVAVFAMYPLTLLPLEVFRVVWAALNVGALIWMTRGWALPLLLFPPVTFELYLGQIHLILAAMLVLGLRYPAAWAGLLLTKVTPGVVVLWYLVRREWHAFAITMAVTLGLVLVTMDLMPGLWTEWVAFLRAAQPVQVLVVTTAPLLPRLVIAAGIVVVAGWRGWAWLLPVAAVLALPTVWIFGLSMLVACIPLAKRLDPEGVRQISRIRAEQGDDLDRGPALDHDRVEDALVG